jgi:hypothetical protein
VYSWNAAAARRLDEAESAVAEAERLAYVSPRLRMSIMNTRAFLAYHREDLPNAARLFAQLRDEHRALGNSTRERMSMLALAEVEYGLGNTQAAIAIVREVLAGVAKYRYRVFRASLLSNLAGYLLSIDDRAAAYRTACEAIDELAEREPEAAFVVNAMLHVALVWALEGEYANAARLLGYIDAVNARHAYGQEHNEIISRDRLVGVMVAEIASEERAKLIAEGASLAPEVAIALVQRKFSG